jgi:hypothetical protein
VTTLLGELQWFAWKSKKKREKEEAEYIQWAFPHGTAQKEKIVSILEGLFPDEDASAALVAYLSCKEVYDDAIADGNDNVGAAKIMKRFLNRYKKIVRPAELPYYIALVLANAEVGPDLNYPL